MSPAPESETFLEENMTTREKIIVALMVVAVAYGAYALFFEKPPGPQTLQTQTGLDSLNTFVTKVAETTKSGLSEEDAYIVQQAESQWHQDPMATIKSKTEAEVKQQEEEAQAPPPGVKIVYSGYLQMGDKSLAIINGMEYETGDELSGGGYVVRNISPSRVVLAKTPDGKQTLVIPLVEPD
jgi:hypothetical protein